MIDNKAILILNTFRGFDCGHTTLTPEDIAKWIANARESSFKRENYKLFQRNCRHFCEHLITQVLRPSDQGNGEFMQVVK